MASKNRETRIKSSRDKAVRRRERERRLREEKRSGVRGKKSEPQYDEYHVTIRVEVDDVYIAHAISEKTVYNEGEVGRQISEAVETGAEVNVPLFINEGDKIKIETEKGTYKERIKE